MTKRSGKRRVGRVAAILAAVAAGYLLLLFLAGFALRGCVADRAEARLSAALDADVSVGRVSLGLIRGHIELGDIRVTRPDGGHLELTLDHIDVDVAPLGWIAVDRDIDRARVRGASLSLSVRGAADLPRRSRRRPIRLGGLRLEDVRLEVMPTALLPGLGRVELTIPEAQTGPVRVSSALSWLFALDVLEAQIALPGGIQGGVRYADGQLALSAGLLGSRPVSVPFTLPALDPDAVEADQIRALIRALLQSLGKDRAKRWLEREVKDRVLDLLD